MNKVLLSKVLPRAALCHAAMQPRIMSTSSPQTPSQQHREPSMQTFTYETLNVTSPRSYVYQVELNRPKIMNAFNETMWQELGKCFEELDESADCRAIILSGAGKHFSAGIDLNDMMLLGQKLNVTEDVGRRGRMLDKTIRRYQGAISSVENCRKPVIAAVHSACVGAGLDLVCATDIRLCTKDAWFQVKEVSIGMAADVGTLQRLPKIIGNQSLVRELCFTARKFESEESLISGMVSRVFLKKEQMMESAIDLAAEIAKKSPIAVQTTKENLVYSQHRSNQDGLDHIRELNKLNLQSEDFINACVAEATKGDPPLYAKL